MTSRLVNASFSLPEWQAVKMIFFAPCVFVIVMVAFTRAVLTLYRTAFGPTRHLFRIEPLFTHENGDFGAISVTERSRAAPILKVERESLQFLRKKNEKSESKNRTRGVVSAAITYTTTPLRICWRAIDLFG